MSIPLGSTMLYTPSPAAVRGVMKDGDRDVDVSFDLVSLGSLRIALGVMERVSGDLWSVVDDNPNDLSDMFIWTLWTEQSPLASDQTYFRPGETSQNNQGVSGPFFVHVNKWGKTMVTDWVTEANRRLAKRFPNTGSGGGTTQPAGPPFKTDSEARQWLAGALLELKFQGNQLVPK